MTKLPSLKAKQVVRVLQGTGFVVRRQTGSHLILRNRKTGRIIPIPIHNRDIKKGLLFAIIKEAGMNIDEFLKLL